MPTFKEICGRVLITAANPVFNGKGDLFVATGFLLTHRWAGLMGKQLESEEFVRALIAHQNALYAYLLTLVPSREVAMDLLQDTCVKLWSKANDFVPGSNFLAWACRIAYFTVLAYRRDRARERTFFDNSVLEQLAEVSQEQAEKSPRRAVALDECLNTLSPQQRKLILERYGPDGSVARLAADSGRSARGLAVTLHRIRQALLDCVENKLRSEGP
jgi:RNA polymerase sigma-70 factor (ECF subfamily)